VAAELAERAARREALLVAALAARPEASRVGEPVARSEAFLAGTLQALALAACPEAAQAARQEWLVQLDPKAGLEAERAARALAQVVLAVAVAA
jgi:hypothetical protein